MDLEEFVSGTLTQIVKGVVKAQDALTGTGALINPSAHYLNTKESAPAIRDEKGFLHQVREVEFDVAVTVGDVQAANAGAGIQVFGAKIGARGEVTYENSTVSRVKFVVPIAFPSTVPTGEQNERDELQRTTERANSRFERVI